MAGTGGQDGVHSQPYSFPWTCNSVPGPGPWAAPPPLPENLMAVASAWKTPSRKVPEQTPQSGPGPFLSPHGFKGPWGHLRSDPVTLPTPYCLSPLLLGPYTASLGGVPEPLSQCLGALLPSCCPPTVTEQSSDLGLPFWPSPSGPPGSAYLCPPWPSGPKPLNPGQL